MGCEVRAGRGAKRGETVQKSKLTRDKPRDMNMRVAQIAASAALRTAGALPENVNYALKSSYGLLLLESVPDAAAKLRETPTGKARLWSEVVQDTEAAVALVLAY